MKISHLEYQLVAVNVLVNAGIEGTRTQLPNWGDPIGLERCRIAQRFKLSVEAGEVGRQRRLLHSGCHVQANFGAAHDSPTRPNRHIGKSDPGCAGDPVKVVFLHRTAG